MGEGLDHRVELIGRRAAAVVRLDLDLATRGGVRRSSTWHHLFPDPPPGRVAVVTVGSGADGAATGQETAWIDRDAWPGRLVRAITAPPSAPSSAPSSAPPSAPGRPPLPDDVSLPYELLIGAGRAIREGRLGVLDELAARYAGGVLDRDGGPYTPAGARALVDRLHEAERGSLLATVTRRTPHGTQACGLASWLLFDRWRALEPTVGADGEPRVRVRSVGTAAMVATIGAGLVGGLAATGAAA